MFNPYQSTKNSSWAEVTGLFVVIGVAGMAAFGLGFLWAKSALALELAPLEKAGLLAFVLLFLGATAVLFGRQRQQADQQSQAAAELSVAQARFHDTFDQFPLSVQVLRADGTTVAVNRAWEKLFGGTLEDVEGFSLFQDRALQESAIVAHLQRALEGETASSPAICYDMVESWPFSSHDPQTSRWIKCTICPVKEPGGSISELIIVHEDVTDEMVAREARHESEARKAAIVEVALDCIISMDGQGIVIEWNPSAAATFGYSREEAMGQLLADLIIPAEHRERHAIGLQRYIDTGQAVLVGKKVETEALRSDGEMFPVELAITPIRSGEHLIFSAFLRDLTQVKAAETALQAAHDKLEERVELRTVELRSALDQLQSNYERLERLEDLRDTLTGMVVHDLRTPLSSMLFGLQTVNYLGPVTPAQQECLDVFTLGCKDSLSVINDLLDIGKMESGAFALQFEECDATSLVKQALDRVAMLAGVKKLSLVEQIDSHLPTFQGDREKLGRLLGNLLGNAIKFAPQGGVVTLGASLSPGGTSLHLWVKDNGAGIPREAFARIFEKFGQAENRLGDGETSSGLGLAFCKMIVEAHQGQIWVESAPGQGSLFTAALPLTVASA